MRCKKPFTMKGVAFGCGQCMMCRIDRRRVWVHRMALEALTHPESAFVTLTYDKEHLPHGGSLVPRDLQLWLKRLRKKAGAVRFFGVGEYGDQTWRPHYHVALFGCGRGHSDLIREAWEPRGFIHVGDLTVHSASYVAGYVTKKMTGKDDERLCGRFPEFARMSLRPGIGAPAVQSIAHALLASPAGLKQIDREGDVPGVLRTNGRLMPLGRYLRSKIRDAVGHEFVAENPERIFAESARLQELYKTYKKGAGATASYREWALARKAQQSLNVEARVSLRNGGKL